MLLFCGGALRAQCLNGFTYTAPITIVNGSATALTDHQVKVTVNTAALVTAGKMRADGADMRFLDGSDCCAPISYFIESGMNSATTVVWVKVPSIGASSSRQISMAYGNPTATETEILEAARAAYVDRFVHALPDGYDTVIDEEGSGVSAGEKQLITIARAFLAKPSILILDEATSSVDTRTELLVQHATAALRRDRTTFVIAHRLSTIRDADMIVVMEQGRIVEHGTHDRLLEEQGAYYRLYNAQFAAAAADAMPAASTQLFIHRAVMAELPVLKVTFGIRRAAARGA